jgi:hypothetical protein
MTETQPVEPRADDEQSRETEEPLPAGKAAKRERRAARRGGSQRQRKARKQGAAATPADGEQSGGRRRRKARQQLPDATTDHTDEPETGPHRTADAA